MAIRSLILCLICCPLQALSASQSVADDGSMITITHYQSQSRYEFGHKLLVLALSKLKQPYAVNAFSDHHINEARGEKMVISGKFDIQWMSTSSFREEQMIPIKMPIYKGILGLRLLLVKIRNKKHISQIRSLADLQKYTGGHGSHWGDLPVYKANKLPVHTNANYEPLFLQLANERFDYFHRGLNEIWKEKQRYDDLLAVADNIMLFYPQPVYFFVSKSNPRLADELETGLKLALKDGSYKKLFLEHHQNYIKKGNLKKRGLIQLVNPVLPINTPKIDTSWWLPVNVETL